MDFEIILEGLHACPVENLLSKFTLVNFRKSDTYPSESGSFHWGILRQGCFNGFRRRYLFFSLAS